VAINGLRQEVRTLSMGNTRPHQRLPSAIL